MHPSRTSSPRFWRFDGVQSAAVFLRSSVASRMSRQLLRAKVFGNDGDCKRFMVAVAGKNLKGTTIVKLTDGTICNGEVHWYEAHGIGAKEFKIKRILELQ